MKYVLKGTVVGAFGGLYVWLYNITAPDHQGLIILATAIGIFTAIRRQGEVAK